MKRPIPFLPEYDIDRDGRVWRGQKQVYPVSHIGKFRLYQIAVNLSAGVSADGTETVERHYVWKLLSATWYDGELPLNREGGVLHYSPETTFSIDSSQFAPLFERARISFSPEDVQFLWYLYQDQKTPCFRLAEVSGLINLTVEDFRTIITECLKESVR